MRARTGLATVVLVMSAAVGVASIGLAGTRSRAISGDVLQPIDNIVEREIAGRHVPGAVVLVGQDHEIVYRRAFGLRASTPRAEPMTVDTIFDLASLTKVVCTATAVMQFVDRGRIDLDAPAATYWAGFAAAGKRTITIRDLLTHYSGLKPDLGLRHAWSGYRTAMRLLAADPPLHSPGSQYVYSDENFEVLGEIVRRVSATTLGRYCDEHIFKPLGMADTRFRPSVSQAIRIAPTSSSRATGDTRIVNDPTAQRMGGIAGHAGLFSTADDLAIFATMMIDGGTTRGVQILNRQSVELMTHRASPPTGSRVRGLGWDLAPATDAGTFTGSYEHTGFTGTMIWIDPVSRTYVIILSNRTYPDGRGDAQTLRNAILAHVTTAIEPVSDNRHSALQR